MEKLYNFVDKFKLDDLKGENTSNSDWKDGVDYWYFLEEPIPCVYRDGDKEINAFCEMINLFHPSGDDDSKYNLMFGIKLDKDAVIEDVEKYIICIYDIEKEHPIYKNLVSIDTIDSEHIKKLESYFLRKAYKEYVLQYKEKEMKEVLRVVKELEKEHGSEEDRTIENIKACYIDDYILDIWDEEKYKEETGEGWHTFEDFIISFIEQNIIFE